MKKNPLVSIASLGLVFIFFLAGCGTATEVATPTPYPTPVKKTYTVQRGNIVINADLFGSVTPLALETVYFQMDGHVGNVYVQVNDTVKKGNYWPIWKSYRDCWQPPQPRKMPFNEPKIT